MGIWLAEAPDDPVAITLGPDGPRAREGFDRPIRRAEYSHRLWPEPSGLPVRIGDASRELDQTFGGDRALVSLGWAHADGADGAEGTWSDDVVDTAWRDASASDQPLAWVR